MPSRPSNRSTTRQTMPVALPVVVLVAGRKQSSSATLGVFTVHPPEVSRWRTSIIDQIARAAYPDGEPIPGDVDNCRQLAVFHRVAVFGHHGRSRLTATRP